MAVHPTYPQPLIPPRRRTVSPWLLRIPILALCTLALFVFMTAAGVAFVQLEFEGRIYPGVSALGMDLGGQTPQEAFTNLSIAFTYPDNAVFTLRDGDRYWQVRARDLGVSLDAAATAEIAYQVGRSGNLVSDLFTQLETWLSGASVAPLVRYDESRAAQVLAEIAAEINRPVQDAEVRLQGMRAVTTPSAVGRAVQVGPVLDVLRAHVMNLDGAEVPLIVEETPPVVWEAADVAAEINALLSAPLTLYIANPREGDPQEPWVASPEALAQMLVIDEVPNADGETAHYEAHLNTDALRAYLEELAPQLAVRPQDARFVFDDETGALEPLSESVNGRALSIEGTLAALEEAAFSTGRRDVPMVFNEIIPVVHTEATAESLGIRELVAQATTYFSGSSAVRQANIKLAASRFHGLVIAPGQEFSFNQYLGDVSAESGYEEGLIIFNGRTVRGVGGGVCQVSTTAFQAAFYAGFPITERYPHGYRVGYYETGEGAGMDATVFEPIVDLKFVNDTPYYLLIETYFNANNATLTYKFYSTSMNRQVVKEGPFISNIVPHGPTKYEVNPELAPGQRRQVDYAVDGADVTVRRVVYQDGEILRNDTFLSHYLPWQAVIQVAPGELPGGQTPESPPAGQ
ncbi:MAG: VanW family protein [Anaerolineae bacterium]